MPRYQEQITDELLRVVPNAQIWVFHASGPELDQLATLTDDDGQLFDQPLISDFDGIFYYNTSDGLYENHVHYWDQLRYVQQCQVGEVVGGGGGGGIGVTDGDKGDIVISGDGTVYTYQDFAQPISHGGVGDGVTNDHAAVVACDTALAPGAAMVIARPYLLASDLTLARPVIFHGAGKFVLPTGTDLTINAPITADRTHIFDCSGTATARLDVGANHIRFPEWWGAILGADCSAAFVHALVAGTETVCAARDYVVTTNPGILIPAFTTLSGAGPDYEGAGTATRILMVGGTNTIIQLGSTATPIDVNSSPAAAKLKNLCVARNAAPVAGSVGILVAWSRFVQISDVRSTNSLYCWRFTNSIFCEGIRLRAKRDTPINTGTDVAVGFDIYGGGALPAAGGNASLWLSHCQAELNLPILNSAAYNYSGRFTDNFLLHPESVSWSYDLKITGDGAGGNSGSNTNLFVGHPVFDACKIASIRIDDVNKWGTVEIHSPYIGPSADAALGSFNNCLGVISIQGGQCRLTASNGAGFTYVNCRAPILDGVTIAECSTQAVVLSGVVGGRIAPITINATDNLSAAVQAVANVTDCIIEPICTGEAVKVSFGYQSLAVTNDYNTIWTGGMVRAVVNADLSIIAGGELNSVIDGGAGEAGLADGDYGDVLVGGSGTTMTVQSAAGNFAVTGTITAGGSALATVSQLSNYLPLTGGTLTGGLTVATSGTGLNILAGSGAAYFSTDGFTFRNAAQSANFATLNATGLTVSGSVTLTDEVYNSAWNGKLEAPTKNALWDKIETLAAGGSGVTSFNTRTGAITLTSGDVTTALTFTPAQAVHTHAIADTTGLQAALDGKQPAGSYSLTSHDHAGVYAPLVHTHTIANVTGLQPALDAKADDSDLAGYSLTSHTHASFAADITVPDEAYGGTWNGSLEVPTKNAVYDKIEAVTAGGGGVTSFNTRSGAVTLTAADITATGNLAITGTIAATSTIATDSLFSTGGATGMLLEGVASIGYFSADNFAWRNRAASLNYMSLSSGGDLTVIGSITLLDEAYNSAWNGKLEAATKNAIWDKIETLAAGGVTSFNGRTGAVTLTSLDMTTAMPAFSGDVTSAAGATVNIITAGAVTLTKMANMATASLIYRKTSGAGPPEVNTLATLKTDLGLTGTNSGDQTSIAGITGTIAQFNTACTDADFATGGGTATGANTGDQTTITGNAGTATALQNSRNFSISGSGITAAAVAFNGTANVVLAASVDAGHVTLARMANLAANSFIGNNTGSAAVPLALNGTQATALLDTVTTALKGLAPASGGGTTNFLRADGSWAVPPGAGGGVTSFNSRTGAVTLTSADVTTALTFTPANVTALANYLLLTGGTLTGALTVSGATSGLFINTRDTGAHWQLYNLGGTLGFHNGADRLTLTAAGNMTVNSVSVTDEVYNVAWNGKLDCPTKNAVYDKIELLVTDIAGKATVSQLSNYLALTGGTLTGTLAGTALNLSGNINMTGAGATVNISTASDSAFLAMGLNVLLVQTAGTTSYFGSDAFTFRKRDSSQTWATLGAAGLAINGALTVTATGNNSGVATMSPAGIGTTSILIMKGAGGSQALGLSITAGAQISYLNCDNFIFRNAAPSVEYMSLNATGMTVNGTVTLADEAYSAAWNGKLQAPTKNAVYDRVLVLTGLIDALSARLDKLEKAA
jgi:hypothetical protein